jgi:hypothetical protein
VALRVYTEHISVSRVPKVEGATLADAERALSAAGLRAEPAAGDPPPSPALAGRVQRQAPGGGSSVEAGAAVKIWVYPDFVALALVPDLANLSLEEARARASAAGLRLQTAAGAAAATAGSAGRIERQDPAPGARVQSGSTVLAWVHAAPLARSEPSPVQSPAPRAPAGSPGATATPRAAPPTPPPGSDSRPFHAALALYMPKLSSLSRAGAPSAGADASPEQRRLSMARAVAALDVSSLPFERANDSVIVVAVSGAALSRYPRAMFRPGADLSGDARIHFRDNASGVELKTDGALFFRVERVFESLQAAQAAYPGLSADATLRGSQKALVVDTKTADGQFSVDTTDAKGSVSLRVGPLIEGWPDEMKRKFLDMIARILSQMDLGALGSMDCFVATAAYGGNRQAAQLAPLRRFRDEVLLRSPAGRRVTRWYYAHGPSAARAVSRHAGILRPPVRLLFDGIAAMLERVDLSQPWIQSVTELAATAIEPALGMLASTEEPIGPSAAIPLAVIGDPLQAAVLRSATHACGKRECDGKGGGAR